MKLKSSKFGHGLEPILAVAFNWAMRPAMTWVRAWCVYAKYGIFSFDTGYRFSQGLLTPFVNHAVCIFFNIVLRQSTIEIAYFYTNLSIGYI